MGSRAGPGGMKPDAMSAAERLDEVADILAGGLMRLLSRQSTAQSADFREGLVDSAAHQSGHANGLKEA
jgi:hypothetical protein